MSNKLDVCDAAYVWLTEQPWGGPEGKKLYHLMMRLMATGYSPNPATGFRGDLTDAAQAIYDSFDDVDDVINALEDAGVFK